MNKNAIFSFVEIKQTIPKIHYKLAFCIHHSASRFAASKWTKKKRKYSNNIFIQINAFIFHFIVRPDLETFCCFNLQKCLNICTIYTWMLAPRPGTNTKQNIHGIIQFMYWFDIIIINILHRETHRNGYYHHQICIYLFCSFFFYYSHASSL